MNNECKLYVEGKSDKRFVDCILAHYDIAGVATCVIGGGISNIRNIGPQIQKDHDAGYRVAMMLDADSSFAERRDQVVSVTDELDLPIDRFFLLPNNSDSGAWRRCF